MMGKQKLPCLNPIVIRHSKTDWNTQKRTQSQIIFQSLLDVLRDPLEAISISHLADDTAHENLKGPNIGVC
uniref:Uncharacterized protein MANES_15G005900 n=1 Tax=Rhizophora mucronata TaxID=61149 RepID=A0A2P2IKY6_RHIMU